MIIKARNAIIIVSEWTGFRELATISFESPSGNSPN